MKSYLALAAALVAPFALSACIVEDDAAEDTADVAESVGSEAADAADAAADRAEAAADRAADSSDIVIDPPDVVVDGDRDEDRTDTTIRADEDGLEVTTSERRN
ncbi:hypothetical protein [Brevundimonas sp.]|uniref:hypothetical protein n=1 Tax=Brevundimonas sp. TaxID=1871086 RepID=UPI0025EF9269|nr:hypothetical protein [Brevundimonas sp.]